MGCMPDCTCGELLYMSNNSEDCAYNSNVLIAGGAVLGVLLILALVVTIVCLSARKKRRARRETAAGMSGRANNGFTISSPGGYDQSMGAASSLPSARPIPYPSGGNDMPPVSFRTGAPPSPIATDIGMAPVLAPGFQSARVGGEFPSQRAGYAQGPADYYISIVELQLEGEIGRGAYGVVFQGRHRGVEVAIKQLDVKGGVNSPEYEDQLNEFKEEADFMMKLPPHPNVVALIGVTPPPNFWIVTEFLSRGSLYTLLHSAEKVHDSQQMNIIRGIAAGMAHLHAQKIVHRDLAARNILLDNQLNAKISDFGLSRFGGEDEEIKTKSDVGPIKWMSPEAIKDKVYCFPARDHQLLTNRGFLFLDDLLALVDYERDATGAPAPRDGVLAVRDWRGVAVASYDSVGKALVYEQPLTLVYNAARSPLHAPELVEFASRDEATRNWHDAKDGGAVGGISLVVTANHDMYVRNDSKGASSFAKQSAASLLRDAGASQALSFLARASNGVALCDESATSSTGGWRNTDVESIDLGAQWGGLFNVPAIAQCDRVSREQAACLELVGASLTGDCARVASGSDTLVFAASTREQAAFIASRAAALGAEWRVVRVRDSSPSISVVVASEHEWLRAVVGATEQLPPFVWSLARDALQCIVAGLTAMASSGGVWTASAALRDDIVRMLLHAGQSATFERRSAASGRDVWRIVYDCDDASTAEPALRAARGDVVRRVEGAALDLYRGQPTWCVQMPSGFVVVRRARCGATTSDVQMASRATIQGNSQKSDVWSFGVTVWEVLTRQNPYANMDLIQVATNVCYKNLCPETPPHTPTIIAQLLTSCFQRKPELRPHMREISQLLG
jgi:serine/threonine protein kinase